MDYKFYCFDGEPRFLQVNVGRGTGHSTQNYYDLDWQLLPFGKTQPHNPNLHVDRPAHFDEMVKLARELTKPFPYVRSDLYEANGRIYFGEDTFFPCSGMPDASRRHSMRRDCLRWHSVQNSLTIRSPHI